MRELCKIYDDLKEVDLGACRFALLAIPAITGHTVAKTYVFIRNQEDFKILRRNSALGVFVEEQPYLPNCHCLKFFFRPAVVERMIKRLFHK